MIGGPGAADANISHLLQDITIDKSKADDMLLDEDSDRIDEKEARDECPADLSHLSSNHDKSYEACVIEIKKKKMSTSMFTIDEEDEDSCARSRLDNTFLSR